MTFRNLAPRGATDAAARTSRRATDAAAHMSRCATDAAVHTYHSATDATVVCLTMPPMLPCVSCCTTDAVRTSRTTNTTMVRLATPLLQPPRHRDAAARTSRR